MFVAGFVSSAVCFTFPLFLLHEIHVVRTLPCSNAILAATLSPTLPPWNFHFELQVSESLEMLM